MQMSTPCNTPRQISANTSQCGAQPTSTGERQEVEEVFNPVKRLKQSGPQKKPSTLIFTFSPASATDRLVEIPPRISQIFTWKQVLFPSLSFSLYFL